MASASEIAAKLNLVPNPEGGLYTETFRDTSVFLSKSQLPPHYKVDRLVSTCIYFMLQSGNVSRLHRIPCAETWHFYLGEPLTIVELDEKDGKLKLTCLGPDLGDNQQVQYWYLHMFGLVHFQPRIFIFPVTAGRPKLNQGMLSVTIPSLDAPAHLPFNFKPLSSENIPSLFPPFRIMSLSFLFSPILIDLPSDFSCSQLIGANKFSCF